MRDDIRGNIDRVTEAWERLSLNRKIILGVLAVATILAFIGAAFWMRKPEYVPLYSDLSGSDTAEMTLKLKDKKIPYKLAQRGKQILVPDKKLEDALVAVSMERLPREEEGILGWAIFDRRQFGVTDFQQRVNFQRALQDELKRTINRFPGLQRGRTNVQLTIPEKTLFKEEQEEAKAWVSVHTDGSGAFGLEQAAAVANLVAHALPELKVSNVAVFVDGRDVSELIKEEDTKETWKKRTPAKRLEAQKQYDKYLEGKVQKALSKVFGLDKAIVLVNTEIDYSEKEINSETFAPPVEGETEGLVRSSYEERESYTGKGIGEFVGGEPGVVSNVPGYVGDEKGTEGESEYDSRKILTNYELNKKTEHIIHPPGKIDKISTSVFVDKSVLTDLGTQENIRQAVAAAVGADLNPGDDKVVVEGVDFKKVSEPLPSESRLFGIIPKDWMPLIQLVIVALIVLFILGFLRAALRPKPVSTTPAPQSGVVVGVQPTGAQPEGEVGISEEERKKRQEEEDKRRQEEEEKKRQEEEDKRRQQEEEEKKRQEEEEKRKREEEEERKRIRDEVIAFAKEKPEVFATILGTWLTEEGEEENR